MRIVLLQATQHPVPLATQQQCRHAATEAGACLRSAIGVAALDLHRLRLACLERFERVQLGQVLGQAPQLLGQFLCALRLGRGKLAPRHLGLRGVVSENGK